MVTRSADQTVELMAVALVDWMADWMVEQLVVRLVVR